MKKIYVDLQDVLLQYSGNDIIFNKYTVTGRDGGKGKMNSFEEESKKIIETIQTLEADYIYIISVNSTTCQRNNETNSYKIENKKS